MTLRIRLKLKFCIHCIADVKVISLPRSFADNGDLTSCVLLSQ